MFRAPALIPVAAALLLAGCTAAPQPGSSPAPAPQSTGSPQSGGSILLPQCDEVAVALGGLIAGMEFDEGASGDTAAQESYDQRICVFGPATAQLGVTIAAIPFLQTEIDTYGASPNAIADDRTQLHGAVLQTLTVGDGDDGHLDSALYLFDLEYSITIQEHGDALPQLTVPAAADAAFAIRELIA